MGRPLLWQLACLMRPRARDVSFFRTDQGWLGPALIVDQCSRRIDGWATSGRLKKNLALISRRRGIASRGPTRGLIHQPGHNSQCCSIDCRAKLKQHGLSFATSDKGNCYANAVLDKVFERIKSEKILQIRGDLARRIATSKLYTGGRHRIH